MAGARHRARRARAAHRLRAGRRGRVAARPRTAAADAALRGGGRAGGHARVPGRGVLAQPRRGRPGRLRDDARAARYELLRVAASEMRHLRAVNGLLLEEHEHVGGAGAFTPALGVATVIPEPAGAPGRPVDFRPFTPDVLAYFVQVEAPSQDRRRAVRAGAGHLPAGRQGDPDRNSCAGDGRGRRPLRHLPHRAGMAGPAPRYSLPAEPADTDARRGCAGHPAAALRAGAGPAARRLPGGHPGRCGLGRRGTGRDARPERSGGRLRRTWRCPGCCRSSRCPPTPGSRRSLRRDPGRPPCSVAGSPGWRVPCSPRGTDRSGCARGGRSLRDRWRACPRPP